MKDKCSCTDCMCQTAHVTNHDKGGYSHNFPPIRIIDKTQEDCVRKVNEESLEVALEFGGARKAHKMAVEYFDTIQAAETGLRRLQIDHPHVDLDAAWQETIDKNRERGYYD